MGMVVGAWGLNRGAKSWIFMICVLAKKRPNIKMSQKWAPTIQNDAARSGELGKRAFESKALICRGITRLSVFFFCRIRRIRREFRCYVPVILTSCYMLVTCLLWCTVFSTLLLGLQPNLAFLRCRQYGVAPTAGANLDCPPIFDWSGHRL